MCVNKKQKYDGHIHLLYQDIIIGIHEVLTNPRIQSVVVYAMQITNSFSIIKTLIALN
jgi:hypothetical protein